MLPEVADSASARRYESVLVAILFVTYGAVFLDRLTLLFLSPYIAAELHLSPQDIGYLAGALAVTWAFSGVVFGAVSDRYGRKVVLVPAVLAFSLLSWLSGLAHTFTQLLLIRACMGLVEGPCWPIVNALAEQSSHPQRRARNVAIVVSSAAVVGLAAAPVLTTQIAEHYGWRAAFFVAGVPGLLISIPLMLFVKEVRRDGSGGRYEHVPIADYLALLKNRNVLLCCAGGAALLSWNFLLNIFAPLYITQTLGYPGTVAGWVLGAAGLANVCFGYATTALANRMGRKETLLLLAVPTALVPLAMIPAAMYDHLGLLMGFMFFVNGGQTITVLTLILIPTESVSPKFAATAIGLTTFCGEIVGATVVPAIFGAAAAQYGLVVAMYGSAASMLVLFVCALFLKDTTPVLARSATLDAGPAVAT